MKPALNTDGLPEFPAAIRHVLSRDGLKSEWRKIASVIYSPRILEGLPKYTRRLARTFANTDPYDIIVAIQGDPAFFVSYQMRLDQIDCAMVSIGRSLAERSPVIRSKWILGGFSQAAAEALRAKGGTWPPTAGAEPA